MLMFDIAVVITVLGMNALSALCYSREKKRTGLILKALADFCAFFAERTTKNVEKMFL